MAWVLLTTLHSLVAASVHAGSLTLQPSHDTFINNRFPDNNNGHSLSIFTGTEGLGGVLRGLIRFDLPAGLAGRASIDSATLRLTTIALGDGVAGTAGTAGTVSLQALTQPWIEGTGFANSVTTFVVGQACTTGASWNKPECSLASTWSGGSVVATVSASATVPAAIGSEVAWTSAQLIADAQAWLDTPGTNNGWRLTSSTEGNTAQVQRFASAEAASLQPSLAIDFSCKAGFVEVAGQPICEPLSIDIDDNGSYDALTDGAMLVRYLFGLTDAALIAGAIGPNSQRNGPTLVKQYLDDIRPALDVDANGVVEPHTDGLMILRYLFGFRDPALSAGALGQSPNRTGVSIDNYIQASLMP
jgi:hypothetical protein